MSAYSVSLWQGCQWQTFDSPVSKTSLSHSISTITFHLVEMRYTPLNLIVIASYHLVVRWPTSLGFIIRMSLCTSRKFRLIYRLIYCNTSVCVIHSIFSQYWMLIWVLYASVLLDCKAHSLWLNECGPAKCQIVSQCCHFCKDDFLFLLFLRTMVVRKIFDEDKLCQRPPVTHFTKGEKINDCVYSRFTVQQAITHLGSVRALCLPATPWGIRGPVCVFVVNIVMYLLIWGGYLSYSYSMCGSSLQMQQSKHLHFVLVEHSGMI